MTLIGNLIWFLPGGFFSGLAWLIAGMLWCLTIVGIPFGRQFFKIAKLALAPFGATVQ